MSNAYSRQDEYNIPWDLRRRGLKDAKRHDKRMKDAMRENLRKLINEETIITSDGHKMVKIPIKYLEQYRFKHEDTREGVGQGQGDVGDVIAQGDPDGPPGGQAGDQPGEDVYEAEIELEEITEMLLNDFGLPWLEQKEERQVKIEGRPRFDDIRKNGPLANLDKRRTIIENLKRNAQDGNPTVHDLKDDDLRFKVWDTPEESYANAAVYMLMDRSGSMNSAKKDIARIFFFWMVRFLRLKYDKVDIVFIAHDTEAKVVPEKDFFAISNSGGTKCSSAYTLALDHIRKHHPKSRWNNYVFHFSDGDNYTDDNELCKKLIAELLEETQMVGYGEISEIDETIYGRDGRMLYGGYRMSTLHQELENFHHPRFVTVVIRKKEDIYGGLKKFLMADQGEKDGK